MKKILITLAITAASVCGGYFGYQLYKAQPPRIYREVMSEVHSRITYKFYKARDWRYIKPGEHAEGNCAVFAYTAFMELTKHNVSPQIKVCTLPDGTGHAYTWTEDGWAFDVRYKDVATLEQVASECK